MKALHGTLNIMFCNSRMGRKDLRGACHGLTQTRWMEGSFLDKCRSDAYPAFSCQMDPNDGCHLHHRTHQVSLISMGGCQDLVCLGGELAMMGHH